MNAQSTDTSAKDAPLKDSFKPDDVIEVVTPRLLAMLLQQMGYRGELFTVGDIEIVRSATSGLPFEIRLGNRFVGPNPKGDNAPAKDQGALDFVLLAGFKYEGETFPLDLLNHWNIERRFGRLFYNAGHLLVSMDVVVAGGIRIANFRGHIELWDKLLQELVPYLRNYSSAEHTAPAAPPPGYDKATETPNKPVQANA